MRAQYRHFMLFFLFAAMLCVSAPAQAPQQDNVLVPVAKEGAPRGRAVRVHRGSEVTGPVRASSGHGAKPHRRRPGKTRDPWRDRRDRSGRGRD